MSGGGTLRNSCGVSNENATIQTNGTSDGDRAQRQECGEQGVLAL